MIEVRGLVAGYGLGPFRKPVLRGVDLAAEPGMITAVVGPNGVGKTTLFRTLLGVLRPFAGDVRVGGLAPRAWRRRHGVAFLPENTPVPPGWTFADLLDEGCDLQGLAGEAREAALERARSTAGLPADAARSLLSNMSKGTVRRAVLAYALLGSPGIVLLDEPMSGLDTESRVRLRAVVEDAAREGATVIMTTHELGEVARVAGRAVVLRDGKVAGTVEGPAGAVDLERAVLGEERTP